MLRLTLIPLLTLLTACPAPRPAPRPRARIRVPPPPKRISPRKAPRPEITKSVLGNGHCPFGDPKVTKYTRPDEARLHAKIKRDGYKLLHSSMRKIALWVCERVDLAQLQGRLPRRNRFRRDPELQRDESAALSDYRRSGYDRGHMAPAGNQKASQRLKDETFYLSNMAPQKPRLNRQVWRMLEAKARKLVKVHGRAYMITGGMFIGPHTTIGAGQVWVPTHFYKVLVWREVSPAAVHPAPPTWKAVGFVLENRAYQRPYDWGAYVKSIDWIEKKTGLNFMPGLSAKDEERLERGKGALQR